MMSALSGNVPAQAADEYCQYGDRTSLFLVDRTTAYDEEDLNTLIEGLEIFETTITKGERLIIAMISDAAAKSTVIFDACMPGCPEYGFFESLVGECKPMVARQDAREFTARFINVLREVINTPQSYPYSAIIDVIRRRATEHLSEEHDRLIVFSDLLENSPRLPWPAVIRQDAAATVSRISRTGGLPELRGAEVVAFGIGREHSNARRPLSVRDRQRLVAFWEALFAASGGRNVRISFGYPQR